MKFTGASVPEDPARSATLPRLVRRILHPGSVVAIVAIAAGVACTGCGGGGDDNGSTPANATTAEVTTVTQSPEPVPPDRDSTSSVPSVPKSPEPNPGNGAGQGQAPPAAQSVLQRLSAFRDCLSRQGVSLQDLRGPRALRAQRQNPERFRAQAEKAFTCIPKLPPQLKEQAEQLKRRFEQRNPHALGQNRGEGLTLARRPE